MHVIAMVARVRQSSAIQAVVSSRACCARPGVLIALAYSLVRIVESYVEPALSGTSFNSLVPGGC